MSRDMKHLDPIARRVFEAFLTDLRSESGQNIGVSWTWRGEEDQNRMVAENKSKVYYPNSKHNRTVNGKPASIAIDIYRNKNGKTSYDIANGS